MIKRLLILFLLYPLWGWAQNQAPVFVLPAVSDTVLEADYDTCIAISLLAPEPGDSIYLWGQSELFNADSNAYLLQQQGLGTLNTYLCFQRTCRKVRPEPYMFRFFARDTSFDTSYYEIRIRLRNSLPQAVSALPNVFTPNNDGINDEFSISGSKAQCAELFNVYIYNRWGQIVYTSNRISFSWDGGRSPDGVYYYIVTTGNVGSWHGTLTLIR